MNNNGTAPTGTPPRFFTTKGQAAPHIGNGQTLGFTRGRGYYARTAAPVRQGGVSQPPGLQPLSGADIANRIAGYVNSLPAPESDQQIQQRAQGMLDPIVQAITGQITAGEKAGAGAITGYTSELAKNLAPFAAQEHQIYGSAQQAQAAADNAESQALRGTGTGTSLSQSLSNDLGQMSGPAGLNATIAAPVAAAGADAGNAVLGTGSSFLDNLIAQGANAESLAAKQPGIAGLTGLRDINNLSLSSQKQLADALAKVQEQAPGLVQSLESQSQTNRANRAQAAEKAREYYGARNDAILAGQAKNQTAAQIAATRAGEQKYAVDTRAATSTYATQVRAQTAQETAASRASQNNFSNRLRFAKTYGYDPVTNEPLPGYTRDSQGHVVKTAKAGSAKGQLTDAQAAKLIQQWHDGKTTSVTTVVTDPATGQAKVSPTTGKPITVSKTALTGTLKYGQAYAMLRQFGKSDTQIRKLLDTVYAKGDSGRAWVTNEQQAALKKAGIPYKARLVKDAKGNSRGLLGPGQYRTLKKAGLLPPGQLTAEGWYVIASAN